MAGTGALKQRSGSAWKNALKQRSGSAKAKSSGLRLTRRRLLAGAGASAAIIHARRHPRPLHQPRHDRPLITHGLQSGDVSLDFGVVWARTDRPSRMLVEVATTDSFAEIRDAIAIDVLPESDFTGKILLEDLPSGEEIFYRISFADLSAPTISSEIADRPFPHRAEPTPRHLLRLVRRHGRPRLGHRRGARGISHLRHHAAKSPGLLHPLRRQHLCRLPDPLRARSPQWRDLAEPRHRGKIPRGGRARRLSRQLQI